MIHHSLLRMQVNIRGMRTNDIPLDNAEWDIVERKFTDLVHAKLELQTYMLDQHILDPSDFEDLTDAINQFWRNCIPPHMDPDFIVDFDVSTNHHRGRKSNGVISNGVKQLVEFF